MKAFIRFTVVALLATFTTLPARAWAPLRVVATTQDLASLAREVGGDKVEVTALASGKQDPHFVEPKPSFLYGLGRADVLLVVGRELSSAGCRRSRPRAATRKSRPAGTDISTAH